MRNLAVLLILLAGIGAASLAARDGGRTVGLLRHDDGAFDGYTLFKPARILGIPPTAYLIDKTGIVRQIFPMKIHQRPSWKAVLREVDALNQAS